ncbi:MAG: hypothetical protein EBU85_07545 [Actinobacteria bacterium]|nr:hypothetical protein [Actinomycetota bacterium]
MAQVSTGMGLAILGGCILGAAALTSHKFGSEAMAQGTGTDRRIVSAGVHQSNGHLVAYRIWSDNAIDLRALGYSAQPQYGGGSQWWINASSSTWFTADNGTSAYMRADVDESRSVDAGDISAVLLDFGSTTDNPPPPIDCTINSPR